MRYTKKSSCLQATVMQGHAGQRENVRREPEPHELCELRAGGHLREFQKRLLDRMSVARQEGHRHESRLGVHVAGRACLLDLREIDEIVQPMQITAVPLTKDWYLGLANVRGNLISVIDLDRFCGAPAQVLAKDSRVIVLRAAHAGRCGFLVSGVLGLRDLRDMTAADAAAQSLLQWPYIRAYRDHGKNVWTELSFALVIDDARFLHIAL